MKKFNVGFYTLAIAVAASFTPVDDAVAQKCNFSSVMEGYIANHVSPDYHRAFDNFMNYDVIRNSLNNGDIPQIVYNKLDGEEISLSVHPLVDGKDNSETLWVFEKV